MPTSSTNDSSLQQALLQEFSWTQASMAEDMERRNRQLAASQAATKLGEQVTSQLGLLACVVVFAVCELAKRHETRPPRWL
jgi:hypothetical protein